MILVIDFYDSFVHNLIDYVHQTGHRTTHIFYDKITFDTIIHINPSAIILSPGPNHPADYPDICDIIKKIPKHIPILGVCLGHQIIGYVYGADIIQTPPAHGIATKIIHHHTGIFKNIPVPILVGRYHSLSVTNISDDFMVTADTSDETAIIMGIAHKKYPIYGVQFHPESLLTDYGHQMIENFCHINPLQGYI